MYRSSRLRLMPIAMAFAMGLGGQLYLHVPSLGVIPMLDLLAYALSVILLILQLRKKLEKVNILKYNPLFRTTKDILCLVTLTQELQKNIAILL